MKADSSEVDGAIVARLLNDPTLTGLCPDGVYFDEAAPGAERFVIVSLEDEVDELAYEAGRCFEDALYLVKAVHLSTNTSNIKPAAKRIDELLDRVMLAPPPTNYAEVSIVREQRIRTRQTDPVNTTIRWDHRGGLYRVTATPIPG